MVPTVNSTHHHLPTDTPYTVFQVKPSFDGETLTIIYTSGNGLYWDMTLEEWEQDMMPI